MDFSKNEEKNICLGARGYSVVHPLPPSRTLTGTF